MPNNVTITRSVKCGLESSDRKNAKLKEAVEEYQEMLSYMVDMMPSIPEHQWTKMNSHIYRMVTREFNNRLINSRVAQAAAHEVVDVFQKWRDMGKAGKRPRGELGRSDYLQLTRQNYDIESNQRGLGLKARFIPYKPEWWHLQIGEYQRAFLDHVIDGDASLGSAQLVYNDGNPFITVTVSWDVTVPEPEECDTTVGVDLGENVLYAAAAIGESVESVQMESGNEFRHHREELSKRKDEKQRAGDLNAVKELKNERRKYTNHMTHRVAKEIVSFAVEHEPCVIHLEDLTDYRETAHDPIHDWPFREIQEKIAYKAAERSVPVEMIDPAYTSQTCRKCGHQSSTQRNRHDFVCESCGYQVHADVNAAMNIAQRTQKQN